MSSWLPDGTLRPGVVFVGPFSSAQQAAVGLPAHEVVVRRHGQDRFFYVSAPATAADVETLRRVAVFAAPRSG